MTKKAKNGQDIPAGFARQSSQIIGLKEEGDEIRGVFLGSGSRVVKGKERSVHYVDIDGQKTGVWGATDMDSKLQPPHVGHEVIIRRTGESIPVPDRTPMTVYDVLVAHQRSESIHLTPNMDGETALFP